MVNSGTKSTAEVGRLFCIHRSSVSLNVEDRFLAVALPELTKPGNDPGYPSSVLSLVLDEVINSRPPLCRQLARYVRKKQTVSITSLADVPIIHRRENCK